MFLSQECIQVDWERPYTVRTQDSTISQELSNPPQKKLHQYILQSASLNAAQRNEGNRKKKYLVQMFQCNGYTGNFSKQSTTQEHCHETTTEQIRKRIAVSHIESTLEMTTGPLKPHKIETAHMLTKPCARFHRKRKEKWQTEIDYRNF